MRALAFGLGFALMLGAWRQVPPMVPASRTMIALVLLLAMFAAYRAGRRSGHSSATAVAVANAQASSLAEAVATGGSAAVNVFIAPPGADLLTVRKFISPASVPEHLADALSPLEQHVELAEDHDPADLMHAHYAGELEGVGE